MFDPKDIIVIILTAMILVSIIGAIAFNFIHPGNKTSPIDWDTILAAILGAILVYIGAKNHNKK